MRGGHGTVFALVKISLCLYLYITVYLYLYHPVCTRNRKERARLGGFVVPIVDIWRDDMNLPGQGLTLTLNP